MYLHPICTLFDATQQLLLLLLLVAHPITTTSRYRLARRRSSEGHLPLFVARRPFCYVTVLPVELPSR